MHKEKGKHLIPKTLLCKSIYFFALYKFWGFTLRVGPTHQATPSPVHLLQTASPHPSRPRCQPPRPAPLLLPQLSPYPHAQQPSRRTRSHPALVRRCAKPLLSANADADAMVSPALIPPTCHSRPSTSPSFWPRPTERPWSWLGSWPGALAPYAPTARRLLAWCPLVRSRCMPSAVGLASMVGACPWRGLRVWPDTVLGVAARGPARSVVRLGRPRRVRLGQPNVCARPVPCEQPRRGCLWSPRVPRVDVRGPGPRCAWRGPGAARVRLPWSRGPCTATLSSCDSRARCRSRESLFSALIKSFRHIVHVK
jgi:hypothetical protein